MAEMNTNENGTPLILRSTLGNAHMFIIPNGLCRKGDFIVSSVSKQFPLADGFKYGWEKENVCDDEDLMVQVWFTGHDSENWGDHSIPDLVVEANDMERRNAYRDLDDKEYNKKVIGNSRMGSWAPISWFEGKKEGDVIDIVIHGCTVSFTLSQLNFRYRSFGSFENCLETLKCKREGKMIW